MSRSKILTHERFARTQPNESSYRELMAVREIVHAFLNADRPEEVFQFALDRVSPLIGASFASVYVIDGVSELMRLAAAFNWPPRYKPWLGEVRVRLGFGPSGEAAAERRVIEIPDVNTDRDLEDWAEVATELGFKSLVALPLQTGSGVLGALTFYFAEPGSPSPDRRNLMRLTADQMAATAEKARLIENLRRSNAALSETNAELERQYSHVLEARRVKDEFLSNVSHELRTPLTSVLGHIALMQEELTGPLTDAQRHDLAAVKRASEQLLRLIQDLLELTSLKGGTSEVFVEEFDPGRPIELAVNAVEGRRPGVLLRVDPPPPFPPRLRSDLQKTTRILVSLLHNAYKFTAEGEVVLGYSVGNARLVYRVQDSGIGIPEEAREAAFEEFRQVDGSLTRPYGGSGLGLALARRLARLLGGDLTVVSSPGNGSTFMLELPLEYDPALVSVRAT